MAVYTDVAVEELAPFLALYDIGELLSYKGIAEGVENSNFLRPHQPRLFHPDALRAARRRARSAVFPGADGASGGARHHLSAAGEEPRRRGAGQARRPARRRSSLSSTACGSAGRAPRIAPRSAKRWRGCISPAAIFRMRRDNALSVAGWRPLYEGCRERADEVSATCEEIVGAELEVLERDWPRGSAARRHPRRSVSRQRVFSRRQAVGTDRFLFRLHRYARLRRRDLPQCLVLRAGSFLQRHQGPRAAGRLCARRGRCRTQEWEKLPLLRARRRAALSADAAGRLARRAARRAGAAEGPARISRANCASTRRSRARAIMDWPSRDRSHCRMSSSTPMAPARANPGPGRLGRDPELRRSATRSSKAARPIPPTTAWS